MMKKPLIVDGIEYDYYAADYCRRYPSPSGQLRAVIPDLKGLSFPKYRAAVKGHEMILRLRKCRIIEMWSGESIEGCNLHSYTFCKRIRKHGKRK